MRKAAKIFGHLKILERVPSWDNNKYAQQTSRTIIKNNNFISFVKAQLKSSEFVVFRLCKQLSETINEVYFEALRILEFKEETKINKLKINNKHQMSLFVLLIR